MSMDPAAIKSIQADFFCFLLVIPVWSTARAGAFSQFINDK